MARWVRTDDGIYVNIDRFQTVFVPPSVTGRHQVLAHNFGENTLTLYEADSREECVRWLDRIMQAEEHLEIDGDALARAIGEKAGQ